MKRIFLLISFVPQLLFAQYQSKEFVLHNERNATCQVVGATITSDTIISLNINNPFSGFFISGITAFENTYDSYSRVTIIDNKDAEYLVYESYPILSDDNYTRFSKVGVESVLLDNIIPKSMKVEVYKASIQIDSVFYSPTHDFGQRYITKARAIRQEQTQYVANRLNSRLREKKIPWFAGYTSIASKTFEEKKQIFGPNVPCLYGFDYYKGGLYIINPTQTGIRDVKQRPIRTNTFIRDFDWRNRHGKNWITSVKEQTGNTCWAFATAATIESNFNIYFNQVLPDSINNLSEQELVSCVNNDALTIFQRYINGGYVVYALDYVKQNGIVREECFPFLGLVSCESKCNTPTEQISFSSFKNLYRNDNFDTYSYEYNDSIADILRMSVIKSPVVVDYFKGGGHSISCVGFHQIQMGDTICSSINTSYFIVVDSTMSHFVDMISWIIKNSWGDDWGENGFAKVSFFTVSMRAYEIIPPFSSIVYSDNDRCVTDDDMDGYYTWGSGNKPVNLPVWIPNEQDGDDSNPTVGSIDEYGNCDTLAVSPVTTWIIDSNEEYNTTDNYTYPNIVITQNGTLTIRNSSMLMKRNSIIRVQNGGKLIINGGRISDANIIVENGGNLIIDNGGLVKLQHNGQLQTQIGAVLLINNGEIN